MKKMRITLLILIILINIIVTVGCWNYIEVDKLAVVAGVAVDKGADGQYRVTVEIVHISGGRDTKKTSEVITMEGKTMLDTAKNTIALSGKKLYWSHTKVIILSKEIASEGVTKVIDWYTRNSETRADAYILVSQGDSAKEIFSGQGVTDEIKSFVLEEALKNQESLSKAPVSHILQFDNDLQAEGISPVTASVNLKQADGKMVSEIMGTAIFKKGKLVGFLNGDETKDLLFIKNKIKGGVLIEGTQENDVTTPVSLEIFKSKTKVTPIVNDKDIKINLSIATTVAIDEIDGTENFIDDKGRKKLEQYAEKTLKEKIESLIKKIQSEYKADVFGFGAKLKGDNTKVWDDVSSNWEERFENLQVDVIAKIHIKNSALLSKPLEESE